MMESEKREPDRVYTKTIDMVTSDPVVSCAKKVRTNLTAFEVEAVGAPTLELALSLVSNENCEL